MAASYSVGMAAMSHLEKIRGGRRTLPVFRWWSQGERLRIVVGRYEHQVSVSVGARLNDVRKSALQLLAATRQVTLRGGERRFGTRARVADRHIGGGSRGRGGWAY